MHNISQFKAEIRRFNALKNDGEEYDKLIAHLDNIQNYAYQLIDELYSKFHPQMPRLQQIELFREIIYIKRILRDLQHEHINLTNILHENRKIYIADHSKTEIPEKYILPDLRGQSHSDIIRENYYRLVEKIYQRNVFSQDEASYINSLLMQIVSRPSGQRLIVKLNYLLESKNAAISFASSESFTCGKSGGGSANFPENPAQIDSGDTYQSIIQKSITPSEGSKKNLIMVKTDYLKSDAAVSVDAYASTGKGLTDVGPAFLLLAHELIHATHNLEGSTRDNVKPFFDRIRENNDLMMESLYPIENSFGSYGQEAEEYWTIEGGKLCENAIRLDYGLSLRTGHMTSEPGSEEFIDLYYLGLCRNYEQGHIQAFSDYIADKDGRSDAESEQFSNDCRQIANITKLEILYSRQVSIDNIYEQLQNITPRTIARALSTLKKTGHSITHDQDHDVAWAEFLFRLPAVVRDSITAISVLQKEMNRTGNGTVGWNQLVLNSKLGTDLNSLSDLSNKLNELSVIFKELNIKFYPMERLINAVQTTVNAVKQRHEHDSTQTVFNLLHESGGVSYQTMHEQTKLTVSEEKNINSHSSPTPDTHEKAKVKTNVKKIVNEDDEGDSDFVKPSA